MDVKLSYSSGKEATHTDIHNIMDSLLEMWKMQESFDSGSGSHLPVGER